MGKNPDEIIKHELEEEMRQSTSTRKREPRKRQGTKAPELSSKKNPSQQDSEPKESKPDKVNLKKVKAATSTEREKTTQQKQKKNRSNPKAHLPSASSSEPKDEPVEDETVTEKINRVRTRRKLLELKAAADLKKPKLAKDLKDNAEVNLINQVIQASKKKVDEINKELQAKLERLRQQPSEVRIFSDQRTKRSPTYVIGSCGSFKGAIQSASSSKSSHASTKKGIYTTKGKR